MLRKRMIFKLGLTVIVGVAVYMYYALSNQLGQDEQSKLAVSSIPTAPEQHDNIAQEQQEQSNKEHQGSDQSLNNNHFQQEGNEISPKTGRSRHWAGMHIAVVVCGDRLHETLVMFKSAALFSKSLLVFHIFTEGTLGKHFQEQFDFWPWYYRERIEYHIYNLSFPHQQGIKGEAWEKLFKPCASQRLFIPDLLTDVDSLVYVDTDVLFLSPVDEIWSFFSRFNSSQLVAVTPEHEDLAIGWYNRFARHPYYGATGINSGVMLMNLTRLRASAWRISLVNLYKEYRLRIVFGDQDLINIYFHFHPGELYVMTCEWNYRPDHCMYMSICRPAEITGAFVLHGSRRTWHDTKQPAFKAVYRAFKEFNMANSIKNVLLENLHKYLNSAAAANTHCGKIKLLFTKQLHEFTNTSSSQSVLANR